MDACSEQEYVPGRCAPQACQAFSLPPRCISDESSSLSDENWLPGYSTDFLLFAFPLPCLPTTQMEL